MDLKAIAKQNNWKIKKLDKVTFFQEGPGVRNHQYTTNGVKLLNVANLFEGQLDLSRSDRFISEEEANGKYSHFLVDEGDLIIACSGIQVDYFHKKMGFAKKEHLPLCMNTSTMRFKTLDANILDLQYLAYFLKTNFFKNQIQRLITGSAQLNFGPSHIGKIDILIPLLETQKKIVEVLDKAQGLIDIRKEQIRLMDKLIQSVFIEMFGDPLSNPNGWKTTTLDNVSKLERGRFSPRPRNDPQYFGGKYPYIQTGDISKSDNRLNSYTQTLNEKGGAVSKEFVAGTIVIAIVGATIGATALLYIDVYAPDSIIGISVDDTVCNNIFLEMQLRCMRQWLLDIAPEGARANINLRILSQLRVIVPPIDKQREFAEIVHVIEEQKKELVQRLEDLIVLKNSLEKTLFPKE